MHSLSWPIVSSYRMNIFEKFRVLILKTTLYLNSMSRPFALLFKAGVDDKSGDSDPYVAKLTEIGVDSRAISVLSFDFVNLDELSLCLEQSESFSGIIFSSPRVVEAVGKCTTDIGKWKNLFAFAVGEKTAEEVRHLGLNPIGSESGTGAALADLILKSDIRRPLLLPCGNLSTNTLYDKLSDGGVAVRRLVVYQTVPNPELERNMLQVLHRSDDSAVDFVMYFSPSGVSATMPIFNKLEVDLSTIKFGAIGPTTQAALSSFVDVAFVAEKPTPQHFADALKKTLS